MLLVYVINTLLTNKLKYIMAIIAFINNRNRSYPFNVFRDNINQLNYHRNNNLIYIRNKSASIFCKAKLAVVLLHKYTLKIVRFPINMTEKFIVSRLRALKAAIGLHASYTINFK